MDLNTTTTLAMVERSQVGQGTYFPVFLGLSGRGRPYPSGERWPWTPLLPWPWWTGTRERRWTAYGHHGRASRLQVSRKSLLIEQQFIVELAEPVLTVYVSISQEMSRWEAKAETVLNPKASHRMSHLMSPFPDLPGNTFRFDCDSKVDTVLTLRTWDNKQGLKLASSVSSFNTETSNNLYFVLMQLTKVDLETSQSINCSTYTPSLEAPTRTCPWCWTPQAP